MKELENMNLITVFTPTYNRAYCLNKCYESMQKQSCNSYMSKSVKIRAGWVVLFPDSYCWFHTLYAKITGLDKKYKIE